MSASLAKGQKADITKSNPGLSKVIMGLGWTNPGVDIDGAAFLLGANGKCPKEEDFVFYGNAVGRQGAVVFQSTKRAGDNEQIMVDFSKVPPDIEKISFTITIYDSDKTFKNVSNVYIRVCNHDGVELFRYNIVGIAVENAIVAAEIYHYKGEWKFNAVGSGYLGGLAALCNDFGVAVAGQKSAEPLSRTEAKPVSSPQPTATKVNLAKIELKKKGQTVSLEKKPNEKLGEIRVNLNWNQKVHGSGGLWDKFLNTKIDLDLGCLYELKNGEKGVVQALGNTFGSKHQPPYVMLDRDDRTGAEAGGENLFINGDKVAEFRRILVYAFIYEGVPNWAQADGVVTIKQPGGPDIEVRMDEHSNRQTMCAIAMIENMNNETFRIQRLVQYFKGHRDMDDAFGWNLHWIAGRK